MDLIKEYKVSVQKATSAVMLHRSVWYYKAKVKNDEHLCMRMNEIAHTRIRYGFWRIFILLRREGFRDNHKRVYRLYKYVVLEVGQSLKDKDIVNTLEQLQVLYGIKPWRIKVDNGPEFVSKELDRWAYENKVTLDFSHPGRPTDNPFIGSFNGSFRDECLNTNWFLSLQDARAKIELWRRDYNSYRPHSFAGQNTGTGGI